MTTSNIIDALLLLCIICQMIQLAYLRKEKDRIWRILIGLQAAVRNSKVELNNLTDDINTILAHISLNEPEGAEDEKAD